MKFNINNYASVVLTQTGADIFNKNEEYWESVLPPGVSSGKRMKEGDVLKTQMWDLFHVFGRHINIGSQSPFDFCEIELHFPKDDS